MALTNEQLIEELSNKPIMEIVDLVRSLEDKWGVTAAAPVAVAAAADAGAAEEAEEQTEFDVILTSFGSAKVPRHQGGPIAHGSGSQGGQGPGRSRPQRGSGSHYQGRSRGCEEAA